MQAILSLAFMAFEVAWPAVLVGGLFLPLAALARTPDFADKLPPSRAFLLVILSPLVPLIWAGVNWGSEQGLPSAALHWRSDLLLFFLVGAVVIAIGTPIWFRRAPRWWLLVPCSLATLANTAAIAFVGSMAIANDWL
jgi:hypothetical protein